MAQRGQGIVIRDAHFPGRAPVDAYGNGGFRFAKMSHRGSILSVPSGIYGWLPATVEELTIEAFERVFEEAGEIEVLLIGTGPDIRRVPPALREEFRARGIRADSMATGAAVRTYNVLLSEDRAVAAALLAVD
ncbi:hypothetical protein GR183_06635 [Stappia sp. GBMRC 2046]|uniref:NADH dehydrogenase [ubiquinone] 1 alpha subcomplex assembly factor 3 n=1 Tax=Stappia sediminis TaxID=2692190 RepID=A0A7X3S7A5_9HYPH|nr:Mth938-like domain-containing protein [Stappia sediminis]MXN64576.1 hypothetical protein [Stappia sediminis]